MTPRLFRLLSLKVWLCLEDGCYEISVGGGAFESEVGFDLADEHGGHFTDVQVSARPTTALSN